MIFRLTNPPENAKISPTKQSSGWHSVSPPATGEEVYIVPPYPYGDGDTDAMPGIPCFVI